MCTGHISYAVGVSSAKMDNAFLLLHKWGTISKERNPITAPMFAIKLDSLKKLKEMNDCVIKIQDNDEIIFPTPSEGMNQPTQGKVLYAPNSTHISFELFMRC